MLDAILSGQALWFGVPALAGTGLFLIRLILMMTGLGDDLDGHDGDTGDVEAHHDHSTWLFKMLSVQTLAAFAMGFGWAGVGAYNGSGLEMGWAILIAIAGGLAMVWLLGLLLKSVSALQASDNVDILQTVGLRGSVEVMVPGSGRGSGRVAVVVKEQRCSYNAVTEGEDLPSRTPVVVLGVTDDRSLKVVRA